MKDGDSSDGCKGIEVTFNFQLVQSKLSLRSKVERKIDAQVNLRQIQSLNSMLLKVVST